MFEGIIICVRYQGSLQDLWSLGYNVMYIFMLHYVRAGQMLHVH